MKTAISIPDEVFVAAEWLAERLGVNRSQLYSSAIAQYIATHRSKGVTARLNAVDEGLRLVLGRNRLIS